MIQNALSMEEQKGTPLWEMLLMNASVVTLVRRTVDEAQQAATQLSSGLELRSSAFDVDGALLR